MDSPHMHSGCWRIYRNRWLSKVLVTGFILVTLDAAFAQVQVSSEAFENAPAVSELMNQLGSPKYAKRERATRMLILRGLVALDEVRVGLSSNDAEVRSRCKRIERSIVAQDREHRVLGFLSRVSTDRPVPGWELCRDRLGDTGPSRVLMAAVLRESWADLEEFESAGSAKSSVAISLIERIKHRRRTLRLPVTMAQMVTAMLMCCDEQVDLPGKAVSELLSLLHQYSRDTDGGDPWEHSQFRQMAGMVIQSSDTHSPEICYQGCSLAMRHGLKEGIYAARSIIRNGDSTPSMLQYAILTVARFGSEDHIEILESHLADESTCYRRNVTSRSKPFECQVRDVAMAATMHLLSQDPRQFGYVQLRHNSISVFQPHTLGFSSDEDRTAAKEKWKSFRSQIASK